MPFEYPTNFSNGSIVEGAGDFFLSYPTHIIPFFGIGIILLIWLLIFGITTYMGSRKGILVASFITFIFSIFLSSRGILNPVVSIVLVILVIFGLLGSKEEGAY